MSVAGGPPASVDTRGAASARPARAPQPKPLRAIVLLALFVAGAVTGAVLLTGVPQWPVDDFIEYWAAGRLLLSGANPYSPSDLLALQVQHGWQHSMPLMMWNPPPALTLVAPFGALDLQTARFIWLVVGFLLTVICSVVLWLEFGGAPSRPGVPVLVALTFFPTVLVLFMGQIGVWMLVGVTGFLWSVRRERLVPGGAWLALLLLKPHVTYLLLTAVAVHAVARREWRLIGALVAAVAVASLVPWLLNPDVGAQYVHAVRTAPPLYWLTATIGSFVRQAVAWEREWLQFLPPALGLTWFVWYWRRRAATWSWTTEAPLLLLVSATTMAFGWPFDLVVLLPPVLQAAVWISGWSGRAAAITVASYVGVTVGAFVQSGTGAQLHHLVWLAPVLLAAYLTVRRAGGSNSTS